MYVIYVTCISLNLSNSLSFIFIFYKTIFNCKRYKKYFSCILTWIHMYTKFKSVPIATNVVSSNPTHGEVYWIQHYVIKFVSSLWQVSGFLWVLPFPPLIKLTATINVGHVSLICNEGTTLYKLFHGISRFLYKEKFLGNRTKCLS